MRPLVPPLLAGAAATAGAWHWAITPSFPDQSALLSFGGTLASISTTMLGFVLAATAVLASINHTHLVGMMRKTGHYRDLLTTMLWCGVFFLACALSGFAILFGAPASTWLLSLVVGLHIGALVSLIDVGRKLWLVLVNLRPAS